MKSEEKKRIRVMSEELSARFKAVIDAHKRGEDVYDRMANNIRNRAEREEQERRENLLRDALQ